MNLCQCLILSEYRSEINSGFQLISNDLWIDKMICEIFYLIIFFKLRTSNFAIPVTHNTMQEAHLPWPHWSWKGSSSIFTTCIPSLNFYQPICSHMDINKQEQEKLTQCKFANWGGNILPWEIISHLSCSLVLTNLTYFAHWNDSFSFVFVCKYCNFHLSFKLSFTFF